MKDTQTITEHLMKDPPDFSFVLGGPLFQFFRRTRLSDDDLALLVRRIVAITLFCWLPLLLLSAVQGQVLGGGVTIPFLLDMEAHVKFLLAVPLLVAAELVVHQRMRHLVRQFLDRRLIPESALPRFGSAVSSALRLRNSVLAEVLLIAFVYGVGVLVIWRHYVALDAATWYAVSSAEDSRLSLAGMWYGFVSLPVFQFLLLRWYYRLILWARFLWQVSRIELRLIPTHPDRLGGLGFVSGAVRAFGLFAAAHGALLAGQIANRILFLGATLPDFKVEIAVVVLLLSIVVFGPLLVFTPQLDRVKRTGKREYDTLAQRYVREFDAKWLRGEPPAGESLLGSADIQSLADLGGSLEVVHSMRTVPVAKEALFQLVAAILAPVLPLVLTMMPLEELMKKLFGMLF